MSSVDKSYKKEKNQNIQVFVRLRPINNREKAIRSHGVVDVINNREVVVRQSHQSQHTKRFTFDRAFGPNVEQVEVYKDVVSPLIAEVLAGYNCTVFAYGQTGTGKTHTMVGENSGEGTTWQNDPLAGIIPRALSQLFDELRISNTEYNVRVSYLEIYNEELCDLLSTSMDNSKLRLYEDVNRKGSTIVSGLEEMTVYNKNEVYDIMALGQERKKVASTLMNSQSSRSHTVFTIVVHIKESNSQKGEELVKIGKLNLVDLAGSENISKAGSDNPAKKERARECVNINQSLLTLGRVITALVEKHPHIPYRESKLTRILQESLGGRTKTSIIATISPGHKDLEETMSTLEYANRAKNIQNKPEVNQKMTKQAVLKEYAEEVDKLKRELSAAREKHGVYLPTETYEEMLVNSEEHRKEISELLLKERALLEEKERMEAIFKDMEEKFTHTTNQLASTKDELEHVEHRLAETSQKYTEQKHLVNCHLDTEKQLTAQARQVIASADEASEHAQRLHDTVDRRRSLEDSNQEAVSNYRQESAARRHAMRNDISSCQQMWQENRELMQGQIDEQANEIVTTEEMNVNEVKLLADKLASFSKELKSLSTSTTTNLTSSADACVDHLSSSSTARRSQLTDILAALLQTVDTCRTQAAETAADDTVARATQNWLSGATARVSCLQKAHTSFTTSARTIEQERQNNNRQRHAIAVRALEQEETSIAEAIAQMEADKLAMEQHMCEQMAAIQAEREAAENRLKEVVAQVDTVRTTLNENVSRHLSTLTTQRQLYEQSTARCLLAQKNRLEAIKAQKEQANHGLEQQGGEGVKCGRNVDQFDDEFGDGTSAIKAEMEAFSHSVVQLVAHTTDQLIGQINDASTNIQQKVEEMTKADTETTQKQLEGAKYHIDSLVTDATNTLQHIAQNTEAATSSSMATLANISTRCSSLSAVSSERSARLAAMLGRGGDVISAHAHSLSEQLTSQEEVEGQYLMREFRVYAPSGATPARQSYSYPRRLAATSPHDRILHRLRARTAHSPDSDCIVVESDSDARRDSESDEISESSVSGVSEDSGVAPQ